MADRLICQPSLRNSNFALRSFTLPCSHKDTTLKRLQGQPSGKGGLSYETLLAAFVAGLLVAVVAHLMGF